MGETERAERWMEGLLSGSVRIVCGCKRVCVVRQERDEWAVRMCRPSISGGGTKWNGWRSYYGGPKRLGLSQRNAVRVLRWKQASVRFRARHPVQVGSGVESRGRGVRETAVLGF